MKPCIRNARLKEEGEETSTPAICGQKDIQNNYVGTKPSIHSLEWMKAQLMKDLLSLSSAHRFHWENKKTPNPEAFGLSSLKSNEEKMLLQIEHQNPSLPALPHLKLDPSQQPHRPISSTDPLPSSKASANSILCPTDGFHSPLGIWPPVLWLQPALQLAITPKLRS